MRNIGKFIIVEGDDYSGKSTFVKQLKKKRPEFVYSREPGGSPASEKIRELLLSDEGSRIDPRTRFYLFWASRVENLEKVIIPALLAGKVVVTDRFDASTYAYQVGGDEGYRLGGLFWETRERILALLPRNSAPNYLIFRVSLEAAEMRRRSRKVGANHFDRKDREYRRRVSDHYRTFSESVGGPSRHPEKVAVVDANRSERTVFKNAYRELQRFLNE